MDKSHRANHEARKKRGHVAFAKKIKSRKINFKCSFCGHKCRESKLEGGFCPVCREATVKEQKTCLGVPSDKTFRGS